MKNKPFTPIIRALGILGFVLLYTVSGNSEQNHSTSPYWWKIEMVLTTSGHYEYKSNNLNFTGDYSFDAVILGSLQEDEEDYIFFQAYQEIKNLKWQESVTMNGKNRSYDLYTKITPEITLNYVFKKEKVLSFDFDFSPLQVPAGNPAALHPPLHLQLPQSAGDVSVNEKENYIKHIITGSNRVTLPEENIYKKKFNTPNFHWTRQQKSLSFQDNHKATVKLNIIRLDKQ